MAFRLSCLSGSPNKPCLVAKWKEIGVMFDCGMDQQSLMAYVPYNCLKSERVEHLPHWSPENQGDCEFPLLECGGQIYVDGRPEVIAPEENLVQLEDIDAIVISNYTAMLALPFITESGRFKGKIFATDPTVALGRLYMEELVELFDRSPADAVSDKWKEPEIARQFISSMRCSPKEWRSLYTLENVRNCLAKIQVVAYRESLDLFGLLKLTPVSSGFCIGSCNWVANTDYEKICYMGASSALTTHPKGLDMELMKNADVLIITSLSQAPHCHPDIMLGEFCTNAVNTIKGGGNVLVPCFASGVTYDLFECLATQMDQAGLSQVPMYFLSPAAECSLAYANIYAEWLSESKQHKVYIPEEPFVHGHMVKTGRIKHFSAVYNGLSAEYKTPCIMFAGHPSLRIGDSVHFMEFWGADPKNTVILVEPDFMSPDILTVFHPLAMKVVFCPIDTSLDFTQTGKILAELKPSAVYTPVDYTKAPVNLPGRSDLTLLNAVRTSSLITFRRGQVQSVPFVRHSVKVQIDAKIASGVDFFEYSGSNHVCSVGGLLNAQNYKYQLKAPEVSSGAALSQLMPATVGSVDSHTLQKLMAKGGIEVKTERSSEGDSLILVKEKVTIRLSRNNTDIIMEKYNGELRKRIREMLLQCLTKI